MIAAVITLGVIAVVQLGVIMALVYLLVRIMTKTVSAAKAAPMAQDKPKFVFGGAPFGQTPKEVKKEVGT